MTDIDTLKRAAELLRSLDHVEIDATNLATALESLAERMGQEPLAQFDDPRVQTVYRLLCSDEAPPNREEHWEGWVARRIVDALFSTPQPTSEDRLTQALAERDELEERATALAEAVGEYVGVDVGEWTSANDPISAAMEAIEMREQVAWNPDTKRLRGWANDCECVSTYLPKKVADLDMEPFSKRLCELAVYLRETSPQPTPDDVRDARRYRWLRKHCAYYGTEISFGSGFNQRLPAGVDTAIDSAMQQEQAK